jgi:hypothetical protein
MTLNRRYSAYLFAGTATRTAIVIGLHLNVPESQLPDPRIREHRKRLFWTAFVLDRIFAAKLNHPPAIQDEDIDLDLPSEVPTSTPSDSFGDAEYHIANVTLARLLSSVIRSVYNVKKQAEGTCADVLSRAQACLNDLQSWYEALPRRFQIEEKSLDEHHELQIVSLHLRFYQVVPLLSPDFETRLILISTLFWPLGHFYYTLYAIRLRLHASTRLIHHPRFHPAQRNFHKHAYGLLVTR